MKISDEAFEGANVLHMKAGALMRDALKDIAKGNTKGAAYKTHRASMLFRAAAMLMKMPLPDNITLEND